MAVILCAEDLERGFALGEGSHEVGLRCLPVRAEMSGA
jgi:hypothetical protein